MAGVVQFSEAAQTGEAEIQRAEVLFVCMEDVDAKHIREKFPFGEYNPAAVVLGKNPLLQEARQDAQVFFVANGVGEAGGRDFADWLGKPICCCIGGVQGLDGAALIEAFETAKEIKPDERTTAKTSAEPVTKAAAPERNSAKPMDKYLQDISPEEQPEEDDAISLLDARRFDQRSPPPKPTPILTINGKPISTSGNVTVVSAQAKSGKSAVLGAMTGALLSEEFTDPAACFGFEGSNPDCLAVVHFDTEQSPYDAHCLILRALRRAGLDTAPTWLRSYCLTDLGIEKRRTLLDVELRRAKKEHGGIRVVLLDGIADFCIDPNNSQEAFGLVGHIHAMAIEFSCAIVCVLHENPSPENIAKTCGHLGSQLERKAETNLRLVKDGDGITVIFADRARHCHLPRAHGPRFQWDPQREMHVLYEKRGDEKSDIRDAELNDLAEQIFDVPEAIHGLKWDHVHDRIEKLLKLSRSGARKKFTKLINGDFIRKSENGLYIK